MNPHSPRQHSATEILREIADLGPMRKGSLCQRTLKRKNASGEIKTRGPYWYYTFKIGDRTAGKMVTDAEAPLYQEQIDRFRRFQSLTQQFAELSRRTADQEAKKAGRKKTLGSDRRRKRT